MRVQGTCMEPALPAHHPFDKGKNQYTACVHLRIRSLPFHANARRPFYIQQETTASSSAPASVPVFAPLTSEIGCRRENVGPQTPPILLGPSAASPYSFSDALHLP